MEEGPLVTASSARSFARMLEQLDEVIAWIRALDIAFGAGNRYILYRNRLAGLVAQYADPGWRPSPESMATMLSTLYETADITGIVSALSEGGEELRGLKERLQHVVQGPELVAQERPENPESAPGIPHSSSS